MKRDYQRIGAPRSSSIPAPEQARKAEISNDALLRQELDLTLASARERDDPIPIDEAKLRTYTETLKVNASDAADVANWHLRHGAFWNFKNAIASGHVHELVYDTRMVPLNADDQTRALEELSIAVLSRVNWKTLQLCAIPCLPEHNAHATARKALIDALAKCQVVDTLRLLGNAGSDEFMAALTPEHRFKKFELSVGMSAPALTAKKCLAELCRLLEHGQIANELTLLTAPLNENTPELESLGQRLASAIGSVNRLPCLAVLSGIDLILPLVKAIGKENGPPMDFVSFHVVDQPTAEQARQLVDAMACILGKNMLTGMQLTLSDLQTLTVEDKKIFLQAAIKCTSLCDRFTLANTRREFFEMRVDADVENEGELVKVDLPDRPTRADREVGELIVALEATLQRNRNRALKGNLAFVAGAAGAIPFFGSGNERFFHRDIGLHIASALQSTPPRYLDSLKEYDLGGLHMVNRAARDRAPIARSDSYMKGLRELLREDRSAYGCQKAILRLRTLLRGDVLMKKDLIQAILEIGQRTDDLALFGLQAKLVPRAKLDWKALRWFQDIRKVHLL
jgi:hypothetical protein